MPNLFGTAPNQAPTNGDLGTLAFQDANAVKITGGEVTAVQKTDTAISETMPSLNLDFANTKSLDPRITFTRNTTATFYDGKTVAKAEENLLLQSQSIGTSPWFNNAQGSGNILSNNAGVSPDGSITATSLTFASLQYASRGQAVTTTSGLNYTFSFWAKRISGNTALHIIHANSATGADTAFTITNEWSRYSATVLGNASNGSVTFGVQDKNASGFGEILIWGAQLEQRSAVSSYTPTTSSPVTNYIPALQTCPVNSARFDHDPVTGESKGLLIEEQRTNLLTYSSDFENVNWVKFRSTLIQNNIISPDGTLSGDRLIEDTTASLSHGLYQSVSISSGTAYTYTAYFKAGERSIAILGLNVGAGEVKTWFNLAAGTVLTNYGTVANIQAVGNGWHRCSVTLTSSSTTATVVVKTTSADGVENYTGNGTSGLYIWGAQLEAGAFPTSYIPTTTAQVTRSADAASITGTNFSSWYRADEGTVYIDALPTTGAFTENGKYRRLYSLSDGGNSNTIQAVGVGDIDSIRYEKPTAGSYYSLSVTSYQSGNIKYSAAYKVDSYASSLNGGSALTSGPSGLIPVVNKLSIGIGPASESQTMLCGTISKLTYFPKRLSNDELVEMTA